MSLLDGPDEWRCPIHGIGHPAPWRQAQGEFWAHACCSPEHGGHCPGSMRQLHVIALPDPAASRVHWVRITLEDADLVPGDIVFLIPDSGTAADAVIVAIGPDRRIALIHLLPHPEVDR